MLITARSLYRDTKNFFLHQYLTICLLAILTASITIAINYLFISNTHQLSISNHNTNFLLNQIKNLNLQEKKILIYVSCIETISSLIGNVFLIGGILYFIPIISSGKKISFLNIIHESIKIFPKLFLLTVLINAIIQLSFMIFLIPGILMIILLAPAPIIFVRKKSSIVVAIYDSLYLSWNNIKLISPAVMFWLLLKIFLLVIMMSLPSVFFIKIFSILFGFISNLIGAMLIIYLSRFYMLIC